jgi:hypothetical protein
MRLAQDVARFSPRGVTAPIPVTTTLLILRLSDGETVVLHAALCIVSVTVVTALFSLAPLIPADLMQTRKKKTSFNRV